MYEEEDKCETSSFTHDRGSGCSGDDASSCSSSHGNIPQQLENYPLCFSIVAPRAGAQNELLSLLQTVIVAPLVEKEVIREFRILAATPPSFVAEESSLIVFELIVPCCIIITDWEIQQWQWRLGSSNRL